MIDALETAQKMLEKHPLCNHCLGRQFALLGHGIENEERGKALKLLLTMKGHQLALSKDKAGFALLKTVVSHGNFTMAMEILRKFGKKPPDAKHCYLCNNRLDLLDGLVKLALVSLEQIEYSTFLVGIELPTEVEEREDEFKGKFSIRHGESMRNEFSRNIGKRIAEAVGKATSYERPEIVILVNPFAESVWMQVNPLYVSGRYRKLERGIPQSRWLCSRCRGKGCQRCNWTGRMYPESVEEIVGNPLMEMTEGEDYALHGAGREDIDARMLGLGRPFVLEVKKPKKRFIDLGKLEKLINTRAEGKVEVSRLKFSNKDVVRRLKKGEAAQKLYRAIVEVDKPLSKSELTRLQKSLNGVLVKQQTPKRVMHRRADLVREKYIYKAKVKRLTPDRFEIQVQCQGGLYIKELVTGDEGRTMPSVAEILKAKAVPLELDVLGVFTEGKRK